MLKRSCRAYGRLSPRPDPHPVGLRLLGPELFEFFEAEGLEYILGMAKNDGLLRLAEPPMGMVRVDAEDVSRPFAKTRNTARAAGRVNAVC